MAEHTSRISIQPTPRREPASRRLSDLPAGAYFLLFNRLHIRTNENVSVVLYSGEVVRYDLSQYVQLVDVSINYSVA